MIVVHATVPIDPDEREDALGAARSLAEESRDEDGVVSYEVAVDADEKKLLRFFERYEDEAAFEAHASSEHFADFVSRLPGFLDGEPKLMRFEVSSATELEL